MAVITNPDTRAQLKQIGCLINNRVYGPALAFKMAQLLEAGHVAATAADIATVERTVGQLVEDLIGTADDEVVEVARGLLSASANGQVQKALSNGYLLCGRRSKRQVTIDGENRIVTVATRFLSADPDVFRQYVLEGCRARYESAIRNAKAQTAMIEQRQPGMRDDVADFLHQLNAIAQRELPNPAAAAATTTTTKKGNRK